MTGELNEGVVGDTAKLMMHRLIARMLRRDPSLIVSARIAHTRQADQVVGWPFVREWDEPLAFPARELASKLTSRAREMVRLRNSSASTWQKTSDLFARGEFNDRRRVEDPASKVVDQDLVTRTSCERTERETERYACRPQRFGHRKKSSHAALNRLVE
ncbi:hypothetical protein AAFG07_32990 [Bradyrhizobium sp. B097]|uniref:hypothetical protein n=1 Tax=Bradyrhizobium sp. B097 TaxID=3140244 RepID=UPI0031832EFF